MNHADPTGLETGQVAYDSISQMPTHGSAVDFHNFGQGFAEGLDTILRSGGSLPSSNSDAQLFGQAIGSIAGSLAIMCQGGICGNGSNYSPVPAMGRASVPEVAEPVIAAPYARPNNATTPAQRASVQGQPCVDCGAVDPLAWYEGSGTSSLRYIYTDYHGSVIGYTDASGNLQDLYKYGPYGEPKNGSNAESWSGLRFRYTGQLILPEAKLYYYKARVYDPVYGRFLQTDPIGTKDDLDLYAYTGDDPINGSDPTGEACVVANGWSDYCRRAFLYQRLDGVLGNKTRFYGAASLTVGMLADLSLPIGGQLAVSGSSRTFMSQVSASLEKMNMMTAKQIQSGALGGPNLDARMVHMEQSHVQGMLDAFKQKDANGYNSFVDEMNSLLNPTAAMATAANMYPSDAAYQQVLNGVRGDLGRNINFANQGDRERIGNALIKNIKNGTCRDLRSSDEGLCN